MYQKVLQINTGGDESRLRSPVDLSTGNTRIPSDRDIRALRRHLLREKLASDDTTMTGQTVTGTTIDSVMEANSCLNYAQVPRESKYVANMEYDLLRMAKKRTADGDYKSLAKPGLQPDKHHSPEEKVNTDVLTDSKESSADHGEDFVLPDPQFHVNLSHESRHSNKSTFEKTKKETLNLPPAGHRGVWKDIDDELAIALPLVFTKQVIHSTNISKLAEKLDNWVYMFFKDKFGILPSPDEKSSHSDEKKSHPKSRTRLYRHRGLEKMRRQKSNCRKERRALIRAGLIDSDAYRLLSKRYLDLLRAHNRLRRAVHQSRKRKEQRTANRVFEKDPYLFATKLFQDEAKKSNPAFTKEEAESYFCSTYRDDDRSYGFAKPNGLSRPSIPDHLFTLKCPTLMELVRAAKGKRNGAATGLNGLPYTIYKRCRSVMMVVSQIVRRIWVSKEIPESWAAGYIILISKSDNLKDPAEFRPIAITPTIGKLFFTIISDRLQKFMVKNSFIDRSV